MDAQPARPRRAYVAGDLDAEGDFIAMVEVLRDVTSEDLRFRSKAVIEAIAAARRAGVIGRPLPPPPQEARLTGRRHSLRRDSRAISHHYDVGNDFYRIVLGESMTYSCARFVDDDSRSTTPRRPSTISSPASSGSTSDRACACSTSGAGGARW